MAVDEASSEHFAMPAAAISRDEIVDRVLPVGQIAPLLCEFVEAGRARS